MRRSAKVGEHWKGLAVCSDGCPHLSRHAAAIAALGAAAAAALVVLCPDDVDLLLQPVDGGAVLVPEEALVLALLLNEPPPDHLKALPVRHLALRARLAQAFHLKSGIRRRGLFIRLETNFCEL